MATTRCTAGTATLMAVTMLMAAATGLAAGEADPDAPTGKSPRSKKAIDGGKLRFWPERPDQATVSTATFLGGAATEWLVGGGFQADGTVVVVGNVLGGDLAVAGTAAKVIGSDRPKPASAPPAGKPGAPAKPSWLDPAATGFVARLSPDLRTVVGVTRLPWGAGAITDAAVRSDGVILIAGRAGDGLASIGGSGAELAISPDAERKSGLTDRTFIAALSADGATCLWWRSGKGLSDAPFLRLDAKGEQVHLGAQDVRLIDAKGATVSSVVVPGGVREHTSVSPVDGTIIRGGERMWGTGREPWRCPRLHVVGKDGKPTLQLYEWAGPYVGLDNIRLVSDSAIRLVNHDHDGNILFTAWSDGGNSVMTRMPYDVRRGVGMPGLGLNAAGAGATSFAYVVRLDPKTFDVTGWTFWCTRYGNKANGITVNTLALAQDGSACLAGGAAWGLTQTRNRIGRGEPAGSYIAVLTPNLEGARFVSAVAGTGVAQLRNDADDAWGIASGAYKGKTRVLFAGSAAAEGDVYGLKTDTPTENPMQRTFGGGASDGYLVVLDMASTAPTPAPRPGAPARMGVWDRGSNGKDAPTWPADGARFELRPNDPTFVTADVEFRDADGVLWPSFMTGRPVGGAVVWHAQKPEAKLEASCDMWQQTAGDQQRRVLGPLLGDPSAPPPVAIAIDGLGALTMKQVARPGGGETRTVPVMSGKAVLRIGKRAIPVQIDCVPSWQNHQRDGARPSMRFDIYTTIPAADLGLKQAGLREVDMRFTVQAVDAAFQKPAKRK